MRIIIETTEAERHSVTLQQVPEAPLAAASRDLDGGSPAATLLAALGDQAAPAAGPGTETGPSRGSRPGTAEPRGTEGGNAGGPPAWLAAMMADPSRPPR